VAGGRALLAQAARFLAAGGAATAVHYALLVGLVELGRLPPTPATCVGYAAAAALNYGLRRCFVFRSRAPHRRTLPRYLAVLGAGFGLNGGLMALGAGVLGLPYGAVQVVATGLVLVWNFTAHRLWTFGGATAAAPGRPGPDFLEASGGPGGRTMPVGGRSGEGETMKVWRLSPVSTAGPAWQASAWTGAAVVRAETEWRARRLAMLSFGAATEGALTLPDVSPWGDPALVRARELDDPRYPAAGGEAVLDPVGYGY
jgi:putative flippase GtrA